MNVINLPARDWTADDTNSGGDRLASVTALADRAVCNQRRTRHDSNDWAAFDRFTGRIRAMTDAELANSFGICDPAVIASLRELAAS